MRFGIYIHFPWCRKRCPYCDFAIAVVKKQEPPHEAYLAAVLAEFDEKAPLYTGKELVSIYLGGGTPSLWRKECVASLIQTLCQRFDADPANLEISIECNPTDCQPEAFAAWKQAGVNRLLVGVQATNQHDLTVLGRDHRMGDGLSALKRCLNAGFDSVGADVILGVPGSKNALASLSDVLACKPLHLSAYELTIEERTPFAKQVELGKIIPEDEDQLAELYLQAHTQVTALGYEHYEVSSYAEIGHRAIHNSLYWSGEDYLGLGNGAASLLRHANGAAQRWQNHRPVGRYLHRGPAQHVDSMDEVSAEDFAIELLWLAMRTVDGVEEQALAGREAIVDGLFADGLLDFQGGRITPTLRGFLYNNQLIRRLALE